MDLLLDGEEIDEGAVDPGVSVVAVGREQAAERVLHGAGGRGVDMALDRRQVQDVLAEEVVGDADAVREDVVEHVHLRLGAILHPAHVLVLEVVEDGDVVLAEERDVVVEVLTLEGVGHHRLVLDAGDVFVAGLLQGQDRPFELPRRRVGRRERVVPGDVVLEDGGGARVERRLHVGELGEPLDVVEDGGGLDLEDGDLGLCHGAGMPNAARCGKRGRAVRGRFTVAARSCRRRGGWI